MGKIALYIFVVLTYLGLANTFSPYRQHIIRDETDLSKLFPSENLCIILEEGNSIGLFLRTKYHLYKIFYGYAAEPEYHRFQVSSSFYAKHKEHIGMSILSRSQSLDEEVDVPIPPGAFFIGESIFGRWVPDQEGNIEWKFHVPYRQLPVLLGWDNFHPTSNFETQLATAIRNHLPYFGPHNEFGTNGTILQTHKKNKDEELAAWQNQIKMAFTKTSNNPYTR